MKLKTKYNPGELFYFKTKHRELKQMEKCIKNVIWHAVKEVPYIAIEVIKIKYVKAYSNGNYVYYCDYMNRYGKYAEFSETFLNECARTPEEANRMKAV